MSLLGSLIGNSLEAGAAKKENRLKQELLNKGATISAAEFNKRMQELGLSDERILELVRGQHDEGAAASDKTFADLLGLDHAGYDDLLGVNRSGFNDQLDVNRSGFDDRTATNRRGFDELLSQDQKSHDELLAESQAGYDDSSRTRTAGFDARLTNSNDTFDREIGAQDKLLTAQKTARLRNLAASDAERQRQLGFQGQVDDLSDALPARIGYDAQSVGRGKALGDRAALIGATATPVTGPAFAGGASGAYADAAARGSTAGLGDALRSAKLSAFGDAYRGAGREIGGFASDVSGVSTKAALSRSALPDELAVGKAQADNARSRYDFASGLANDMGGRRDQLLAGDTSERLKIGDDYHSSRRSVLSDDAAARSKALADDAATKSRIIGDDTTARSTIASNFSGANKGAASDYYARMTGARSTLGDQISKMLSDYYDGRLGAEGSYIGNYVDSSEGLENKLLNLNNYKMGATTVTSPLAKTVKATDDAISKFFGK